ncbi:MAG: exodeoxyribonuclease VII large subunit [Clostridiales bacterium]|nr:exodeoxyribonuclease VII large subunit [Clostridiales bacterium]
MAETVLPRAYGVSEANDYLREYLEEDGFLTDLLVRGELTGCKRHGSGHIYFTLSEGGCSLNGAMFRAQAEKLQFVPEQGMEIVAWGKVGFYERDGRTQLYAMAFFPVGEGLLGRALAQLKENLAAEGLFDAERKKPLPLLPRSLGVITGSASAAWADIRQVALSRWPGLRIKLYPAVVQGAEAPASICAALLKAGEGGHDVLIVGRGGGAKEDLAAFNTEAVARAVAAAQIPVIAAVGHEIDWSLADLAADHRAATPSHAAALAVPLAAELLARLDDNEQKLRQTMSRYADRCRQLLQETENRLVRAVWQELAGRLDNTRMLTARLEALSPLATLKRGYAVCRNEAGKTLLCAADAETGESLEVVLAKGSLKCLVEKIKRWPWRKQKKNSPDSSSYFSAWRKSLANWNKENLHWSRRWKNTPPGWNCCVFAGAYFNRRRNSCPLIPGRKNYGVEGFFGPSGRADRSLPGAGIAVS